MNDVQNCTTFTIEVASARLITSRNEVADPRLERKVHEWEERIPWSKHDRHVPLCTWQSILSGSLHTS